MKCPRCGADVTNKERYCGKCGCPNPFFTGGKYNFGEKNGKLSPIVILSIVLCGVMALSFLIYSYILINRISLDDVEDFIQEYRADNLENIFRDQYTTIYGDDSDKITVMVYMSGEESAVSADIEQMLAAETNENVNIVIQTQAQRFSVEEDYITKLEDIALCDMAKPSALTDFINWATESYEANRYMLIMWEPEGSVSDGCYHDCNYADSEMSIDGLSRALADCDVKFDLIGFDRCFIGSLEYGYALSDYADYLYASEESNLRGWDYTAFVDAICEDTGIQTKSIAHRMLRTLQEDYEDESCELESYGGCLFDLRYAKELYMYFEEFVSYISTLEYNEVFDIRTNCQEPETDNYDMVDAVEFISQFDSEAAQNLSNDIKWAMAEASSSNENSHGLLLYFPLKYPSYIDSTQTMLCDIGWDVFDGYFDSYALYLENKSEKN